MKTWLSMVLPKSLVVYRLGPEIFLVFDLPFCRHVSSSLSLVITTVYF